MRSNYMQIFIRVECHCWWKLDEEKQIIAFLLNLLITVKLARLVQIV